MNPIVVIPARMGSERLPGKPLADIHGTPMIAHVLRRAEEAAVGPVLVACGEVEIADAVVAAGGEAVLTSPDLPSGSDRVWAGLQAFDAQGAYDVVVNLQGDLPALDPGMVRAVLEPLADSAVDIATLACVITDEAERDDPNVVKVAVAMGEGARVGRALYFSRAAVPAGEGPLYHHVGIYAFRRPALARFVGLPRGVLERREGLEQLRALEAGMRIDAALVDSPPLAVDTPAGLARARAALRDGVPNLS